MIKSAIFDKLKMNAVQTPGNSIFSFFIGDSNFGAFISIATF